MKLSDLIKINEYEWEIPRQARQGMQVPVRLFASRDLLDAALQDRTLEQAANTASLPGLAGAVIVMPDMHEGYGFPIGGVAAMREADGVISPGGIGYDINCGVRLLASRIQIDEASGLLDSLASAIAQHCPCGVGVDGAVHLSHSELDKVCRQGARWAVKKGYGSEADLRRTEDGGCLEGADPSYVSKRAGERGAPQMASLGAGNHFIEVDLVDEIFDEAAARAMGLESGFLAVQIHTGSRGFGHQVATDYVNSMQSAVHKYGIALPDRELVCAPLTSPEGQAYLSAMRCAANYAFANRQILADLVRSAFGEVFASKTTHWQLHQVYDIAHNIGKIEVFQFDGKAVKVITHRKGATRAFGPGNPGIPPEYQTIGQPVLVPGSMGTSSWVLCGKAESMTRSLGSSCHGAGRLLSRRQAKKSVRGDELRRELEERGIHLRAASLRGLAEEAPSAYKDVDAVVDTVTRAGIARKVARLTPLIVIKG